MKLSMCVIARDEEASIADCLDSAAPFVDELLVVDTGSRDGTVEIARRHGARVEHFTWVNDFAAARNAAIEAASGDWILMLDADERLLPDSGPLLRKLAANAPDWLHVYLPRIENAVDADAADAIIVSHHTRFFPRRDGLRFVGTVHEELKYLPAPEQTRGEIASDIRIAHSGYLREHVEARGKDDRNLTLLEQELARRPDDRQLLFYVGAHHVYMRRYAQAVDYLVRSIEAGAGKPDGFMVDAYSVLALALYELNDSENLAKLARFGEASNALSPRAREIIALQRVRDGDLQDAERWLLSAFASMPVVGVTQNYPGAGGWHTHVLLADLYQRMREPKRALDHFEQALASDDALRVDRLAARAADIAAELGDDLAARRHIARALDATDNLESALDLLDHQASLSGSAPDGSIEHLVAGGDWQAAYDASRSLPIDNIGGLARVLWVANGLREQGAADAALDLLGPALDAYPDEAHVHLALVRTLTDLGAYDDALVALEVLRQLPEGQRLAAAA
jgi:glycosyltransferase involved in cell wall biosynthesis